MHTPCWFETAWWHITTFSSLISLAFGKPGGVIWCFKESQENKRFVGASKTDNDFNSHRVFFSKLLTGGNSTKCLETEGLQSLHTIRNQPTLKKKVQLKYVHSNQTYIQDTKTTRYIVRIINNKYVIMAPKNGCQATVCCNIKWWLFSVFCMQRSLISDKTNLFQRNLVT